MIDVLSRQLLHNCRSYNRPTMADKLTLLRPDDWHVHLRDGDLMKSVVGATARQFGRAIVMPNLKPPVDHGGRRPAPIATGSSRRCPPARRSSR